MHLFSCVYNLYLYIISLITYIYVCALYNLHMNTITYNINEIMQLIINEEQITLQS